MEIAMKKQILLYNIKDKKRAMDIRRVLMPLKIRIKTISPDEFAHPIGYLLGLSGYEASDAPAQDYFFEDEMMIMAGFTSYDIDQLIRGFHKRIIQGIPLKAIVTPHNQEWRSFKLYGDLKKEHEKMTE